MMLHHDRHNPRLKGGRKNSKLEAMSISVGDVGAYRCKAIGLRDNLEYRTYVRQPDSHLAGQVDITEEIDMPLAHDQGCVAGSAVFMGSYSVTANGAFVTRDTG
jgi:hypothetical protein